MQEIIKISEGTYRIEDGSVRFFVLEGTKFAIVIDSGVDCKDAFNVASKITKLPLVLLNTHADPDHISGNARFDDVMMSQAEWDEYQSVYHIGHKNFKAVGEGDIIDLGERKLKIIDLPGHTVGSIAILDIANRVLYGGDSIQAGCIYMFSPRRNMRKYIESLQDLLANHKDEFDFVYPSHSTLPINPDIIPKLIDAAEQIEAGKVSGKEVNVSGNDVIQYSFGFAGFYYDK